MMMWHAKKKLMAWNKFNRKYIKEHIDTFERSQTWRLLLSEFEEWKLQLGLSERIQAVLTAAVVVVEAMAARRWEVVEAMAAWRWEVEFEGGSSTVIDANANANAINKAEANPLLCGRILEWRMQDKMQACCQTVYFLILEELRTG